ncbi:MAG TPA: RyR domain-containing protein, partial [Myxococcota bacterium]|nr:RyR domain-containing protein [Myxococcota bacterium]
AGADLLFLEELAARGGATHVVLPWTREAFVRSSVAPAGPDWTLRFERALSAASSLRVLGELHEASSGVGYAYANEVMAGLARLTARALDLDLTPLAVWDGRPGGPGGTAAFVQFWRERGIASEVVSVNGPFEPSAAVREASAPAEAEAATSDRERAHADGFQQQVKAILFADIVAYSRLPETLVPIFVREFKGRVSSLLARSPHAPAAVSTWGDALHFVFDDVSSAALFTLDLVDEVTGTDWSALGLAWDADRGESPAPSPLRLRVALHAGPVFAHFEPIVRQPSFTGAHVTLAARIEPITVPGEVFASEAFAALAAAAGVPGVACDFVGTQPLAKRHPAELRVYRLRRVRALPLDAVARVIHEAYCRDAIDERWETPATNPSLRAWDELPADLQASNREAAADIPAKLRLIGCELEPGRVQPATTFAFSEAEQALLARHEHERWCASQRARGFVHAEGPKDERRRTHPRLVPWDALPEAERRKDIASVRLIPSLLAQAGFRIRRVRREP